MVIDQARILVTVHGADNQPPCWRPAGVAQMSLDFLGRKI